MNEKKLLVDAVAEMNDYAAKDRMEIEGLRREVASLERALAEARQFEDGWCTKCGQTFADSLDIARAALAAPPPNTEDIE